MGDTRGAGGANAARHFGGRQGMGRVETGGFRYPPLGCEALAGLWRAPLADYAPAFVRNAAGGYLISALLGVSLILLVAGADVGC